MADRYPNQDRLHLTPVDWRSTFLWTGRGPDMWNEHDQVLPDHRLRSRG